MYNIQMLNKIAPCGTNLLDKAKYNVSLEAENPDAIMVRSAVMHDMEFGDNLLAIARAGAGVNNIPIDKCSENGIVVFNTPGANANAVKELAVCSLFLASRKIVDGIAWAQSLKDSDGDVAKAVEKGKSAYVGPEIMGKKLGVIGLGAIGAMFANAALDLGMEVYGCDPYLTVEAAWSLSKGVKRATNEEIFEKCDYISIHVPSNPATKGMINAETLASMKDGVRILNLARADLVNVFDIKAALESGKVASYVVDFPTAEVLGVPGIITIPHLGASTPESEDNCAVMAAVELRDFIELGNIKNSVNYPNVALPATENVRIAILNKNVPTMLQQITDVIASENINIINMANASKKDNAYTLVEIGGDISDSAVAKLSTIDGVAKVRVIK